MASWRRTCSSEPARALAALRWPRPRTPAPPHRAPSTASPLRAACACRAADATHPPRGAGETMLGSEPMVVILDLPPEKMRLQYLGRALGDEEARRRRRRRRRRFAAAAATPFSCSAHGSSSTPHASHCNSRRTRRLFGRSCTTWACGTTTRSSWSSRRRWSRRLSRHCARRRRRKRIRRRKVEAKRKNSVLEKAFARPSS